MKKTILLTITALIIYTVGVSQQCLPFGVIFDQQSEIDSFQVNYPNCTEIQGDVHMIFGANITNLQGLSVVTSIGGDFLLFDNYTLTNLIGLDNLTSIGGELNFFRVHALTSLHGLENLTSIGDALNIGRTTLKNIDGLLSLLSVGGPVQIGGNDSLTSLNGLSTLSSIGGYLRIGDNPQITSLSGLNNIAAASITDLTIEKNDALSACDVKSVCAYLASPNGTVIIDSNSVGCNTVGEIVAACNNVAFSISGKVTYDDTLTPNQPITNTLLILNNTNGVTVDSTVTDMNGNYQFNNLSNGTYYLQPICTKSWGGGSASDAIKLMMHYAHLLNLTGLRFEAGDIDGSGFINTTDAFYLGQRFVFIINTFPVGDWVFDDDVLTINGASVVYNFKGLCVGDVDASYIVP